MVELVLSLGIGMIVALPMIAMTYIAIKQRGTIKHYRELLDGSYEHNIKLLRALNEKGGN